MEIEKLDHFVVYIFLMNSGMKLQNKNMVFDIYKAATTCASKIRTAKCHDRAIDQKRGRHKAVLFSS